MIDGCACGITENDVGLIFTTSALIALVLLSEMPLLAERYSNRTVLIVLVALTSLSLLGILAAPHPYILVGSLVTYISLHAPVILGFDIFFKEHTPLHKTGSVRGTMIALIYTAVLIGLLVMGPILETSYSFWGLYGIGFIINMIALGILVFNKGVFTLIHAPAKISFFASLSHVLKNTALRRIVVLNFLLHVFFILSFIYLPVYLHQHQNMDWSMIGILFALVMLPFIILSKPLGDFLDTSGRNKEILMAGFIMMALGVFATGLIVSSSWILWLGILMLGRIGATCVRVVTESYFFDHVDKKDEGLMSVFRDIDPLATILIPFMATLLLAYTGASVSVVFIASALILLTGVFLSSKVD